MLHRCSCQMSRLQQFQEQHQSWTVSDAKVSVAAINVSWVFALACFHSLLLPSSCAVSSRYVACSRILQDLSHVTCWQLIQQYSELMATPRFSN
jgi:hypothetical protein